MLEPYILKDMAAFTLAQKQNRNLFNAIAEKQNMKLIFRDSIVSLLFHSKSYAGNNSKTALNPKSIKFEQGYASADNKEIKK